MSPFPRAAPPRHGLRTGPGTMPEEGPEEGPVYQDLGA